MYDQSAHFEVRNEPLDFLSEDYELKIVRIEHIHLSPFQRLLMVPVLHL